MVSDKAKRRIISGLASIGLAKNHSPSHDGKDERGGGSKTSSTPEDVSTRRPESTTYRAVLDIDVPTSGLVIGSLADHPNSTYRVATIHFSIYVPAHLNTVKKKVEWRYSMTGSQLSSIYGEGSGGSTGGSVVFGRAEIVFDCHFLGITPLRSFAANKDYKIDCIALSGLGGHAFGSFKQRGESYMWLRDTLPQDLPNTSIILFGYDSELVKSESFQNVSMLASRLRDGIAVARSNTTKASKPLLLIAHSLGGVLVKQALIQMAKGSSLDQMNLKAVHGILFFGVPSQGMNIESLIAMVGDQPNRYLLESLGKESDILQQQKIQFAESFPFLDSKVICFYETMESPTAHHDGKSWTMTGKPSILVDSSSAIYSRPWELGPEYHHAINRTHSEMVKFSPYDEYYDAVRNRLQDFTASALEVIGARFGYRSKTRIMTKELHLAVRNGASKQVQALFARGANINDPDTDEDNNFSPLHRAAEWCDAPMIKLLLSSGADIFARDNLQWTPLHTAARYNSSTTIGLLLAGGADPHARTEDKCTALHLAARYNRVPATVKALLNAGCAIDDRECNDWTPLLLAARYQAATAPVKVLVDAGANMALRCDEGYMPLHLAAAHNSPHVLKILLLAAGAKPRSEEDSSADAVGKGRSKNASPLLLGAVDADGWTALHWAVRFGREENVSLLREYGADVTARDELDRTPAETTFVDHIDESVRERVLALLEECADESKTS